MLEKDAPEIALYEFLGREGYLLSTAGAVERRLQRTLSPERMRELRRAWKGKGETRQAALYRWPQTAEEAHLLFSYDNARTLDSFAWISDKIHSSPVDGAIIDLGCGTGSLLRYLATWQPGRAMIGIDAAENLIEIARTLSADNNVLRFIAGRYTSVSPEDVRGSVLIANCGLDLETLALERAEYDETLAGRPSAERLAFWSQQIGGDLMAWRRLANPGAELYCVLRLPLLPDLYGFLHAAARAGWSFQLEESQFINAEFPPMPAMKFRLAECRDPEISIEELSEWQKLYWPERDSDLAMATW